MRRILLTLLVVACLLPGAAALAKEANPGGLQLAAAHAGPGDIVVRLRNHLIATSGIEAALSEPSYVGSEYCLSCHGAFSPEMDEWHHTLHAFFIREPMGMYSLQPGQGIMADYDKTGQDDFMQGLDFNTITGTALDAVQPNAPILSYDPAADKYYIQLGPSGLKLWVVATLGGHSVGNGQRFMCRVPVSDGDKHAGGWSQAIYFGPLSWGGAAYSASTTAWYTGNTPKYAPGVTAAALGNPTTGLQGQNYLKNCVGCHMTGVRQAWVAESGEYIVNPYPASLYQELSPNYPDLDGDGIKDLINIGCESCHGPGSMHILSRGNPTRIVNPSNIRNNKERSAVCLQCHVRVASAPSKKWGFTYDEAANTGYRMQIPVIPLDTYQVSTASKWPDGWNYAYARIDSYLSSGHYQGSHGIACNDCHNAHRETANPAQVRDTMNHSGVNDIPSLVENDSFCLSCHNAPYSFPTITEQMVKDWDANFTTIRAAIEEHTHHPYGADRIMGLSNCITCHMAPNQGHSFMPARPEDTITYRAATGFYSSASGNVNSCSSACHRGLVRIWQDVEVISDWTNNKFGTPTEIALANHLVEYFGPGGLWWDTTPEAAH